MRNAKEAIRIDSEEQFKNKYKWTYKYDLIPVLKKRYFDLKINENFRAIKREMEKDENFCKERYLDLNKK